MAELTSIRLPLFVPTVLAARLARIAQRRQGTTFRTIPALGREALSQFVERQEHELSLEPITEDEVKRLSKEQVKEQVPA